MARQRKSPDPPQGNIEQRLQATREDLIREMGTITKELGELFARKDALRAALRGINVALGIEDDYDQNQPTGYQAVEIVALEAIDRGNQVDEDWSLTVPEIVEELRQRGWMPKSDNPDSAVRASIRRLREKDPRWGLYDGRLYYHDEPMPSETDDEEDA